ncbi:SusC/RagA family TonB-linked outer membrane protein [Arcticibacter eurypsychrophilus]|uniref:SusC/RagA family TonB-linked outer membrane protein n=1 Tax=Arcticibacter eurypsychrophilus TaxID=1434752 RepID=UPI001B8D6B52|nr:SusC/RagA family TonB-linked outer membrane protein [Arcticibacter eurypsychrophilus]
MNFNSKILLAMKLILAFLLVIHLDVNAKTFSQMVTLHKKNATVEEVFQLIEKQTGYHFLYHKEDILAAGMISIDVGMVSVEEALNQCFKNQPLTFKIFQNTIVIKKKIQVNEQSSVSVQTSVQGQVVDVKGVTLAGVSIILKGSSIGTTTNLQGRYSINAPNNSTLIFSYIGFIRQEVPVNNQTTVNVILKEEAKALSEVVVTALGIKRQSKSLGYAATSVDTKQLTDARTTNVGNSLIGKVAGLNVAAPPTGPGGSSKIRIRGQSSFGGENSPLIVVNGVPINNEAGGGANGNKENFAGEGNSDSGDGLQSINPDDIESMTVLKGAAAAALYGFRAKDGAIIIVTKSGRGQVGIGVELNSNFQADQALDFTDFQYEYGQGENGIRNTSLADARRTGMWSFGTKFDNEPVWQVDGTQKPYSPFKDRVKAFYQTATTATNSVALSGGNDNGSFRLSYANTDANGLIEKSEYNKKVLSLGLNYKLGKKLSTQVNANYSNEENINPPVVAQQDFNVNQTIYTLANSIDPRWLEAAYKDPVTGNEISPSRFTNRTNPYWTINERYENHKRDRLFGNVLLRYQFTPWLYAQGRVGQDYFSVTHNVNRPTGTSFLPAAATGFNGNFYQDAETFRERNVDFLIGFNKKIGVFGIDANVGGNSMDQHGETLSTSVTNFYVRDLYTIGNGQIKEPNYAYYRKKVNSLYGTVEFSYNDYLFLNVTGRNDWFSTLNPKSNNYLYPSVSSSFVFSQALGESLPSWLTYGKIRAAYAEVGGDTDPYTNALFYSLNANPFNGVALGTISGTVSPNPDLKPLKVKETELGIEMSLFDRRVSIDFAAYRKNTVDEILNVDISNASGFGQTKVNVGKLRNQGVEALLTLVPVRSRNIRWESTFNYTYNESKVLQLANNQQRIDVGTGEYIGFVSQEVGKAMGSLRGVDYKRDDQGRVLMANGRFLAGDIITYGSAVPKHIGGWLNTVNYKGLRLFTQVDFKAGHKLISNSNFNFMREGLHKASLVGREGGVVFEGVNADGNANTTAVPAEAFYSDYRGKSIATPFVYDASFIRWRTVSLGYDFSRFVNKTFIKSITLNGFVNNVLIIKKHVDNLDPETQYSTSDLLSGLESLALPTTRSYGLNLNVKF